MTFLRTLLSAAAALIIANPTFAGGTPLGTTFTYQGMLKSGGNPAGGLHDLRFRLYDAASGVTQIGSTQCLNNVTLTDGLFTVSLDFGALAFDGNQRFLEIDVRADTGLDCASPAGFTVLGPRQPLTAAPYAAFALQSQGAVNATQLNSQPASFYTNAANLSTGTLADARLSGNVGLLNSVQTFTGVKTFSVAPAFTAGAVPFSVTSTALVTNLNADRLDGLNSTAFLQAVPTPLTLSASIAGSHIISGQNTSSTVGSSGVRGHASASSGITYGIDGLSDSPNGRGVSGLATAGTGFTSGGHFVSVSTDGTGVLGVASAATGSTSGVQGQSNSTNGSGVFGWATTATGSTYGGRFLSASDSGNGVFAAATATTGGTRGGHFQSESTLGTGVVGRANASTGITHGVRGETVSTSGRGVVGQALATSGTTYGGRFESSSTAGAGVSGVASALTGGADGGRFETASNVGYGVWGTSTALSGSTYGGRFESASTSGTGVLGLATAGTGTTYGVRGESDSTSGRGVIGLATAATGVTYGGRFESASTSGTGVLGLGTIYGVRGDSSGTSGRGVYGQATASTGFTFGGYFESDSTSGVGVIGFASAGTGTISGGRFSTGSTSGRGVECFANNPAGATYAVRGQNSSVDPSAFAVFGAGNMGCSGVKPFRIDHPDDPANKYLLHYSIESPEVLNAYSGKVTLNGAGEAIVDLPHYFAKVNRDPRYTLTPIGAPMPSLHVADEISEGAMAAGGPCWFRIAGGAPGAKVSWRVEAVRNDAWMRARGAPVEVDKPEHERGKYQHPDLYGQPQELGMDYERQAENGDATAPTPLQERRLPPTRSSED